MDAGMPHSSKIEPPLASALVTGAGGFIGRILVRHLSDTGVDVTSVSRRPLAQCVAGRHVLCEDMEDERRILALLRQVRPQAVFHLAGSATAGQAGFEVELRTTCALLRAAGCLPEPPRVLVMGTAAEYGPLNSGTTLAGELTPCRPTTSYGVARLAQTRAVLAAAATQPVVVARLFNIIGPGMGSHLALGRFANMLADMVTLGGGVLRTGSLRAIRDVVAVRDAVRVLAILAVHPAALGRVIPVCSGMPTRMQWLVDQLVALSRLKVCMQTEPGAHGVNAIDRMVGDTAALCDMGIALPDPDLRPCLEDLWMAAKGRSTKLYFVPV